MELLKTTQAAVVAGVELREVNRAIDEGILPDDFFSVDDGRSVAPAGCMLIAFYVGSAEQLTAKERRFVMRTAEGRLRQWTPLQKKMKDHWTVEHEFIAVDFGRFVRSVTERLERLTAANKRVSSSPDILSGTPVIAGTRISVYDVAASVEAGIPRQRILAAYPSLESEAVDLAVLYAKANPPRGRPRKEASLPAGATILSDRRIARRPRKRG
jgi:uncharacterized protein (DUF433 family)